MSEMVEDVALIIWAIYTASPIVMPGFKDATWEDLCRGGSTNPIIDIMKQTTLKEARAAIETLRNATPPMIAAGTDANVVVGSHRTLDIWHAMIDAALSEKDPIP